MMAKLRNMTALYLADQEGMLLLYRIGSRVANQLYIGSAGGHFEKDELNDAKACVLREAQEELGLTASQLTNLTLRYVTLRLKNGEIRQNYYFFANFDRTQPLINSEGELAWYNYDVINQLAMPWSAKHVVEHYIKQGRYDDKLYGGVTTESKTDFVELLDF